MNLFIHLPNSKKKKEKEKDPEFIYFLKFNF